MIEKPLPNPNEDTELYWEATQKGKLIIPKCQACGHRWMPPSKLCPACWSEEVKLEAVRGRGKIFSWIIVHRPQHPAFFAEAPYNVAIVELDEGPKIHTRLVGLTPDQIKIGLPVDVVFEKIDSEVTLPYFKPAA